MNALPLESADRETIGWLAGLLEGEGAFIVANGRGVLEVAMTDRDVIERAAHLMSGPIAFCKEREGRENTKPIYQCVISGERARRIMEIILPLMGDRRARRIVEILAMPNWGFADSRSRAQRQVQSIRRRNRICKLIAEAALEAATPAIMPATAAEGVTQGGNDACAA